MHIVMLSGHFSGGGAVLAATRLGEALARRGHTVARLSVHCDGTASHLPTQGLSILRAKSSTYRVVRKVRPGLLRRVLQGKVSARLLLALRDLRRDVINVHNLMRPSGAAHR
jgi:hypothetical protein